MSPSIRNIIGINSGKRGIVYYVKNAGNDNNTGLSDDQAFATLSKINGMTLTPGTKVLFKKGDTWREQLTTKGSGTNGHPIIFDAYGTGANPIITGANIITVFSDTGSNQWDAALTTQPKVVMFGTTRGTLVANKAAIVAANQWFWTGNVLSVYAISDPSGTIEAGYRQRCLDTYTNTCNYITFKNITFQNANTKDGHMLYCRNTTLAGIQFYDCTIRNGAGWGLTLIGSTSTTGCIVDGCVITGMWQDGIFVDPATNADNDKGIIINNCTIYTNGLMTTSEYNGIMGNLSGVLITNCDIYDNGRWNILAHGIYQYLTAGVVTVRNCKLHDHPAGSGMRARGSCIVENCQIYGNSDCGVNLNTNTTYNVSYVLKNNLIFDNAKWGVMKGAVGTGTVDLTMYHNTILNNTGTEAALTLAMAINSLTVKDNIFYTNNDYCFEVQGTQVVFDIDYNCYYRVDAGNRFKWDNAVHTLAEWQAHGLDVHGVFGNPTLVDDTDPTYDLHLQAGSNCIGTGLAIAGMVYDFDNKTYATPPAIGAYEI